ncbi:MAG: acyl transferase [Tunicatimonas sp.]
MLALPHFQKGIFSVTSQNFEARALEQFRWQAVRNPVYRRYLHKLNVDPTAVTAVTQIPFLPIDFFKRHRILSAPDDPVEVVFESSGTTGQLRSQHHVTNLKYYHRVSQHIFEQRFGPLSSLNVLALLPSYLERNNASLVSMVDHFIRQSGSPLSGFYLHDYEALLATLHKATRGNQPTVLIGVTFALLQLAERYSADLSQVMLLETGGMKGMRRELTRAEVYSVLREKTGAKQIFSEYGMTELLSQAYSGASETFRAPPWMRVLIRELDDPFALGTSGSGGINIIDLANGHSCSFIETMDQGRLHEDFTFEVLGRLDNTDVRGCNTMLGLK